MLEPIETALNAGKWSEALALCEEFLAEHPTVARLNAYHGWSLIQLGRLPEAVEPLRKAVTLEPHFWQASFRLAQLLDRMGRYAEALQHAKHALKEKPGHRSIEGLVRGLERQVPEDVTDAWQVSTKPMFHTVSMPQQPDDLPGAPHRRPPRFEP